MSDDDIDLDRVVIDPDYRRRVIEFLSAAARSDDDGTEPRGEMKHATGHPAG